MTGWWGGEDRVRVGQPGAGDPDREGARPRFSMPSIGRDRLERLPQGRARSGVPQGRKKAHRSSTPFLNRWLKVGLISIARSRLTSINLLFGAL